MLIRSSRIPMLSLEHSEARSIQSSLEHSEVRSSQFHLKHSTSSLNLLRRPLRDRDWRDARQLGRVRHCLCRRRVPQRPEVLHRLCHCLRVDPPFLLARRVGGHPAPGFHELACGVAHRDRRHAAAPPRRQERVAVRRVRERASLQREVLSCHFRCDTGELALAWGRLVLVRGHRAALPVVICFALSSARPAHPQALEVAKCPRRHEVQAKEREDEHDPDPVKSQHREHVM